MTKTEKRRKAKYMRGAPTGIERIMWNILRNKGCGARFIRQALVCGYIADFYCPSLKIVVEADGPHHAMQESYDRKRDGVMRKAGIKVLRFSSNRIKYAPDSIRRCIKLAIQKKLVGPGVLATAAGVFWLVVTLYVAAKMVSF